MKVLLYTSRNKQFYPNFGEGKVRLFSDFDKTYLPSSHNDFQSNYDKNYYDNITNYFSNLRKFFASTKEGLSFTITTGRTFDEFETMAQIARRRKIDMPLPDTLICKNGSDEYIKCGKDETFYNGGEYPFKYHIINAEKEEQIKRLSNWNGQKIKEKLLELFKKHDLQVVEGGSEHSAKDYGSNSFFSDGKLKYETNLVFCGTDLPEWKVGLRKDGNCKIFYTFPYGMYSHEERKNVAKSILSEFSQFMEKEMKVKYNIEATNVETVDNHNCAGRPCFQISPQIAENQPLTKSYDVEVAIKNAIKNNDLVISAGDASNDFSMLNPMNYLKHNNAPITFNSSEEIIQLLDKNEKLAKDLRDLPFIGIIVRNNSDNKGLEPLIEAFSKGKYQKLIVVEEGHLQDGIKEAIKLYSSQNPKYKEKITEDLLKEVYGITKQVVSATPSKKAGNLAGLILALGSFAIGSICYFHKKTNKKETTKKI